MNNLNDDWLHKINRAGISKNDSLITNHQIFFTPARYPASGGVYYISRAASDVCCFGLSSDAYNLHKFRSVWMNSLGGLGLIVGEFKKIKKYVSIFDNSTTWSFIEPCEKMWTKPGALRLDVRYKINIEVMIEGDFAGSTRVCLNDEPCLFYSYSPIGGLR